MQAKKLILKSFEGRRAKVVLSWGLFLLVGLISLLCV